MTNCEKEDTIRFAAYTPARDTEEPARDISWQQKMMTRKPSSTKLKPKM